MADFWKNRWIFRSTTQGRLTELTEVVCFNVFGLSFKSKKSCCTWQSWKDPSIDLEEMQKTILVLQPQAFIPFYPPPKNFSQLFSLSYLFWAEKARPECAILYPDKSSWTTAGTSSFLFGEMWFKICVHCRVHKGAGSQSVVSVCQHTLASWGQQGFL